MVSNGNAAIAIEFLSMVASGNVREGFRLHVADAFTHHNAYFPGDRESLVVAMEESSARDPNKSFTVKQVIDGGDRVALLSHLLREKGGSGYAVVHILRFEGGRIVEMWDVAQEIPENPQNELGMF